MAYIHNYQHKQYNIFPDQKPAPQFMDKNLLARYGVGGADTAKVAILSPIKEILW